ncbi:hypothetical protein EBB79_19760 [Parasedimentitalea marina]|uniref:Uncharacterized protein n=2 Tax=Parasedimentitalea marina TaxID=2483033 RepID=A0A3T0N782_9RHOB|nr:hypothetical protein EBB79_19760 [Parasedimentitalea marina]
MAQGVRLQSAGALAFDNGNVLFVGDTKAGVVHAFALPGETLEDQSDYRLGRAQSFEGRTLVQNIDAKIGEMLGVTAEEVVINDMVVHKPTGQIFLSIHKGRGPDAVPFIVTVDHGVLERVDLSIADHSSISIGPINNDETLEFGQSLNNLAITDIDYYDGEIFVAGVSNEEFASKLRRVPFPFTNEVNTSSIEIWHAVHAQFETRAPIITQDIRELDSVPTLIAIYACTPIVRIPLSDLQDGAQVRGTMIGEMGFGNTPIDIVSFTNPMDNSDYMLVTNTNRSAAMISLPAIASADPMPFGEGVGPVFSVAGVEQYPMPMSGTLHLDLIDEQWAVTIRRHPEELGRIDMHTVPIPFFFDRADHVVEMNWADGPDPFGYKGLPPIEYN